MRPHLAIAAAVFVLAGCGTAPYDPGPEPDAKTILTPQLDLMFPGSAVNRGLRQQAAVPTQIGAVEIAPVRRADALAPAGWIACIRFSVEGRPRYYATFYKNNLLVHHRAALPPDRCENERYALLRAKKPGS